MKKETMNWLEVIQERDQLRDQLTAVQSECTKLLLEKRDLLARVGIAGAVAQVKEFHSKFGIEILNQPKIPDLAHQELRKSLIFEECQEFGEAWTEKNIVEIADALADIIYVVIGTALAYGIPLAKVFDEVHRTNMLKEKHSTRDDGKILKPVGWKPPNIAVILAEAANG